jgi:hypothetical protein
MGTDMTTEKAKEANTTQPASDEPQPEPPVTIVRSSVKIGEDRGNLSRRQEWFERRSGKE